MKRRIKSVFLLTLLLLFLCSCSQTSNNPSFSIQFIDVGQGDSALVECDGHYMLIDGGDKAAGNKVYNTLVENGIQHLDILAISHLDTDHFVGLTKAITYASNIDMTICNSVHTDKEEFKEFETELIRDGSQIDIPNQGEKYPLGSAEVEVVNNSCIEENDSLVLLVTYGKTRFLFTGDIEENAQSRIAKIYGGESGEKYKVDLIKVPHHGAEPIQYLFIRTFDPDYAVISVGAGNIYGHPKTSTLDLLKKADAKVYRTDKDGDIIVKSDGKDIVVTTSK